MTLLATIQTQVGRIQEQVDLRAAHLLNLNHLSERLSGFSKQLSDAYQAAAPHLKTLHERVTIIPWDGQLLYEQLAAIIQFVKDLREIENLAQLRSKVAQLRTQISHLNQSTTEICEDIRKFKTIIGQMREAVAAKQKRIQELKEALKQKQAGIQAG